MIYQKENRSRICRMIGQKYVALKQDLITPDGSKLFPLEKLQTAEHIIKVTNIRLIKMVVMLIGIIQ